MLPKQSGCWAGKVFLHFQVPVHMVMKKHIIHRGTKSLPCYCPEGLWVSCLDSLAKTSTHCPHSLQVC